LQSEKQANEQQVVLFKKASLKGGPTIYLSFYSLEGMVIDQEK
jgi:hypothetical protein